MTGYTLELNVYRNHLCSRTTLSHYFPSRGKPRKLKKYISINFIKWGITVSILHNTTIGWILSLSPNSIWTHFQQFINRLENLFSLSLPQAPSIYHDPAGVLGLTFPTLPLPLLPSAPAFTPTTGAHPPLQTNPRSDNFAKYKR